MAIGRVEASGIKVIFMADGTLSVRGMFFWLPSILGLGLSLGSVLAAREFLSEYLSV